MPRLKARTILGVISVFGERPYQDIGPTPERGFVSRDLERLGRRANSRISLVTSKCRMGGSVAVELRAVINVRIRY